jgi:anti-sigma B factor antagonist
MENPSAMLIRLPERFGHYEARTLAAELEYTLVHDQPCLIVDFSRVKQIDSAGLNMLLACMVKIARRDGAVQLGEVSPEAATMLELTRMDSIFDLFPRISEDATTLRLLQAQGSEQKEEEEEQVRAEEPEPLAA